MLADATGLNESYASNSMDKPAFNIEVKPLEVVNDDYTDHRNQNEALDGNNALDSSANKPNAKVVLKPTGSKN